MLHEHPNIVKKFIILRPFPLFEKGKVYAYKKLIEYFNDNYISYLYKNKFIKDL